MILLLHRVLLSSKNTIGTRKNHSLLGGTLYRFCSSHCWLAKQTLEVLTYSGTFFQKLLYQQPVY